MKLFISHPLMKIENLPRKFSLWVCLEFKKIICVPEIDSSDHIRSWKDSTIDMLLQKTFMVIPRYDNFLPELLH